MRTACLIALTALLFQAPAAMAQQCARPQDRASLDVAALKSQLMVTALSCDTRDKYNAFVLRFRSELMAQERALQAYFSRSFGGRGVHQHDDYITSLANAQSQAGIHDGSLFCHRNAGLMDEVLALPKGMTLAGYAASKGIAQPIDFTNCPAPTQGTQVAQAKERR